MTMKDHKCEICEVNEPIGVASTVMPYSCAYCVECARRFAQPKVVFECFFEDFGTNYQLIDDHYLDLVTYHNGKYINYREWLCGRRGKSVWTLSNPHHLLQMIMVDAVVFGLFVLLGYWIVRWFIDWRNMS
jgi:hypothetical protein